jgi:hypothetical protein
LFKVGCIGFKTCNACLEGKRNQQYVNDKVYIYKHFCSEAENVKAIYQAKTGGICPALALFLTQKRLSA